MTYRLVVVTADNEALRALADQLGDTVSVQIFDSANDALWQMRMNPPEVVIAELELPGMTGMELAEIIPNFEIPTKVVLYSSRANESARQQAEALGIHQFLSGPMPTGELHAALHAALRVARSAAAAAAELAAAAALVPEPEPEPEAAPAAAPRRMGIRNVSAAPPAARAASAASADDEKAERREFTPARVVLPSAREREQAATPPAPPPQPPAPARSGGLASRTRAVAERKPEPRPEPRAEADPIMSNRRGSGTMIVTAENIHATRSIMSQIAQDLGAQSVMLTDRAGMVLVDVGTTDNLPMMIVLPLLSTSFSTAGEVARQLHEEDAMTVYIHDGLNYDLYCFDVVQRFLLVLVFNKKVASSKIGAVWVNAKRAIRELRDTLDK